MFFVVDMEKVIRLQNGQSTVPFSRVSQKYGAVKQNSLSVIYSDDNGVETSLDLIAPNSTLFTIWFEGLKLILKKVRYMRENASVEERFYKMKFEAADRDGSGTLDTHEVIEIINGMNIDMSSAAIHKMIKAYDKDNSGSLDLYEFTGLLTELRRRYVHYLIPFLIICSVNMLYICLDLNLNLYG